MDDSWRVMIMNPILTLFTALLHTPLAAIQAAYRSLQHQAGFSSSQTFFEVPVKPPLDDTPGNTPSTQPLNGKPGPIGWKG
jgi:hypothetical protein